MTRPVSGGAAAAPLPDAQLPPGQAERLRKAAGAFETMAIGEMLKPIFETADNADGPFGGGAGEKMFRPMIVEQIAGSVEAAGGLGLSDIIYRQMLQAQERK